jgi:hypothetical protein
MRKPFALLPVMVALSAYAAPAHGVDRGLAQVTLAGKSISVEYGRPSLSGRDMLAMLQPGQAWRMGADADTTLTSEAELTFGAATLPKGEYILKAKRGSDNKWMLVLTAGGNAVEVPLAEQKLGQAIEMLTIELSGQGNKGQFAMKWGVSALSAPFTAK